MKKLISFPILAVISFFFPILTFAYTSPLSSPPGSAGNPIYVQIEPTQGQKNIDLENSLKAKYGNSAYYSCMSRISGCNGDMSSPIRQTTCLQTIQYNLESGMCGASASPSLTCQSGFTLVNGSCVREVKSPTPCPSGYNSINGSCIPFTCSIGYVPQGNVCVKAGQVPSIQQNTSNATLEQKTKELIELQGNIIKMQNDLSALKAAEAAKVGNEGNKVALPKSNNEVCKDGYGPQGVWTGRILENGSIECDCENGYQFNETNTRCVLVPKIVDIKPETSSLNELVNWEKYHPTSTTTQEEKEKKGGFWSWFLGLLGL